MKVHLAPNTRSVRAILRWSHIVGQFGIAAKVYSGV
jgi:hypothetical protein